MGIWAGARSAGRLLSSNAQSPPFEIRCLTNQARWYMPVVYLAPLRDHTTVVIRGLEVYGYSWIRTKGCLCCMRETLAQKKKLLNFTEIMALQPAHLANKPFIMFKACKLTIVFYKTFPAATESTWATLI